MSLTNDEIDARADLIANKYAEAYMAGVGDRATSGIQDSAFGAKSLAESTLEEKKLIQYGYDEGYRLGIGATDITRESILKDVTRYVSRYTIGAHEAVLHESAYPLGKFASESPAIRWYDAGYSYGKLNESSRWLMWTLVVVGGVALVGGGYYLGTRTPAHEYEKKLRSKAGEYHGRVQDWRKSRAALTA